MIPQSDADQIINQVKESVKSWRAMASRFGISQREIEYFAVRLEENEKSESVELVHFCYYIGFV